jgi:two-component system nitrate/nitrite response regulator NarL
VSNIEILLRSQLVKDALSSVLMEAGFSVLGQPSQGDNESIVVINFDDCRDLGAVRAHQSRGVKVVALASDIDCLAMGPNEIAALCGVLTYDLSADDFVRSLRLICAGERVFPPGQNSLVSSRGAAPQSDDAGLSLQEKELLSHVLEGHSNEVIARHLGLTEANAKVHLACLLRKIRVKNRTQAAIWALANLSELDGTPRRFV